MSLLPRRLLLLVGLALAPAAVAVGGPPGRQDEPLPTGAVARLGTPRFRISESLATAALAPDGARVALAAGGKCLLLDAATGKQVRRLEVGLGSTAALAFAPDGKALATVSLGDAIRLWDVPGGLAVGQLQVQGEAGNGILLDTVTFSPDGKFLAAGTRDERPGRVYVWDVAGRRQVGSFAVLQTGPVQAAFSSDGKILATWGQHYAGSGAGGPSEDEPRRTVQLWDVAAGKELRRIKVDAGARAVTAAAMAPDGKALAVRTTLGLVRVLDAASGKELHRFDSGLTSLEYIEREGAARLPALLQFSADGRLLATAWQHEGILLWDTATWRQLAARTRPRGQAVGLAFRPDGNVIACALDGQALCLWEVKTGRVLTPEGGHHYTVGAVAFDAGGKGLLSAGLDGTVCRWDVATAREAAHFLLTEPGRYRPRLSSLMGRYGSLLWHSPVALSPGGKYAATEGSFARGGVRVWDAASGKVVHDLDGVRAYGDAGLAFSPGGRRVAAFTPRDGAIHVWDVASGKEVRQFRIGKGPLDVRSWGQAAFSPDGRLLAASSLHRGRNARGMSCTLHVWDLAAGKESWSTATGIDEFPAVAFSPDGKLLATGGGQGVVLRETTRGAERRRFAGALGLSYLLFSPDGRTLAGAGLTPENGTYAVYVWEVATGGLRHRYAGHRGIVFSLGFSADGSVLASGSGDTSVLLWDQSGKLLAAGNPQKQPDELWADLASPSADRAFAAVGSLITAPDVAGKLLRDRLHPTKGVARSREEIGKLVDALDTPKFAAREKANRELERLGEAAAPVLEARLKEGITAEGRRRVEKLLGRLERGTPSAEELRALRGVEVLERIGTAEARKLLAALGGGGPGATLTVQARAALARLRGL